MKQLQAVFKSIFDRCLAAIGLLVMSPVMVCLACLIRARIGAPVLFRQIRAGLHGKPFELVKFRTMTEARDGRGVLLPDEDRLTTLGCVLRASSLDELPQLWNVLKGDMSLVGPRPLPLEYLPRYSPYQRRRHEVKPGITGWAQVQGRNVLSWEKKFEFDVWYVDHRNTWQDVKILWLTLATVLRKNGITRDGYATSPAFLGSPTPVLQSKTPSSYKIKEGEL